MSRDVVDVAFVEIDGQELQTVRSFTPSSSDPKAPVNTMNRRRRAIGRTRGVPTFSITMEVAELVSPEYDWDQWLESGDERTVAYEKTDGGERFQFLDVCLDEISEPYTEAGESRVSLTLSALDKKAEQ